MLRPKKGLRNSYSCGEIRNKGSIQGLSKEFKKQLHKDLSINLWKNRKQIRYMLHPTLNHAHLPSKDTHVPGMINLKRTRIGNTINLTPKPRFYNRK